MPKFEKMPKTAFEKLAHSLQENGVIEQGKLPEKIDGYQFSEGTDGPVATPLSIVVGGSDITKHLQPLPEPNVDIDTREGDDWTDEKLRMFFCNPIYAGVGAFPQLLNDDDWVRAAAKSLREDGPEQWLVNMLYALRASIGRPETS
jgi:hypothetical protein